MMNEVKTHVIVGVEIDALWKALSKEMRFVIPKIIPNLVKSVEIIEGDGGIGTVFLFSFGSDVEMMSHQKEKIVELDESAHQIGIQVVEGGHLNHGFSFYQTTFQLSAIEEHRTQVNVKVLYESATEERTMPSKTTASALSFISSLENYLLHGASKK
ncbi:phytohormone-binding protein [Ziziphus jujuba]|uniref:Phytohormone-binding protein n=1 Tax=Ziziphus jujuba TaxID=326968 RepID=A0A6P4BAS2_ZIZJJ|nr:phytohormone-binding protein [Ziziphus jujuba]